MKIRKFNENLDFNEDDFDEEEMNIEPLRVKNVKMVDMGQWDRLVSEVYQRPYNFQQQEGCKPRGVYNLTVPSNYTDDEYMHDTIPEVINGGTMGVKFKVWLEKDPNVTGVAGDDLWWERNFYPDILTVANDLHKKGLLEAGNYVINIDW